MWSGNSRRPLRSLWPWLIPSGEIDYGCCKIAIRLQALTRADDRPLVEGVGVPVTANKASDLHGHLDAYLLDNRLPDLVGHPGRMLSFDLFWSTLPSFDRFIFQWSGQDLRRLSAWETP
jgi:hypothetical protein